MNAADPEPPLSRAAFHEWLRHEGSRRYHDRHPFHIAMHSGRLERHQLQAWVANRYYYQTRIPIKDALIVAKSEEPTFRRAWLRRIQDHDGSAEGEGGLALWHRLGAAVGIPSDDLAGFRGVLPGVRFACDAYVELVRGWPLLEAIASSLTECFAPGLMAQRIAAWEGHYPWVDRAALEYFRVRIPRATRDGEEALAFVLDHARSHAEQAACVQALIRKTEILWHLLDCLQFGSAPHDAPGAPV
jgi:pyrroloquinoline-quinone synthase